MNYFAHNNKCYLHVDQIFWTYHIPINKVENDAFIIGLDNMYMAMMFPIMPKAETIVNNTPSMINRNIITNFFKWKWNSITRNYFLLGKPTITIVCEVSFSRINPLENNIHKVCGIQHKLFLLWSSNNEIPHVSLGSYLY